MHCGVFFFFVKRVTYPKGYSSEWVDGKWYNADGTQTYEATLSWKSNSDGWWFEDESGWYAVFQWQKINSEWYYFGGHYNINNCEKYPPLL